MGIRENLFYRVKTPSVKGGTAQYTTQSHVASLQWTKTLKSLQRILRTAGCITTGGSNVRGYDVLVELDEADEYMVNELSELILHNYRGLYENRG